MLPNKALLTVVSGLILSAKTFCPSPTPLQPCESLLSFPLTGMLILLAQPSHLLLPPAHA